MIETTNQMAIGLSQNLRLKTLAKSQVSVPIKSVGSGYTTCSDIPKSIQIECIYIYIYIGINMGINSHIPEYSKKHLLTLANHGLRRCHHGCLDERLTGDVRKNDNRLTTWVVWLNEWFHMHGHSMDIYIYIWIYIYIYECIYIYIYISMNDAPFHKQ